MLRVIVIVLCICGALYLPLYWNKDGSLAQPARAVRDAFGSKDPRDAASDLYRQQEDANLLYNIRRSGKLGKGFGLPIDYALPITDISNIDPDIVYVPHNGLLWVWMRLGLQGEVLFWLLIGVSLMEACRLAKVEDKQLALVAALTACAIVGYVIQGYNDVGLDSFRIDIALGVLLGCLESISRMAPRGDAEMAESTQGGTTTADPPGRSLTFVSQTRRSVDGGSRRRGPDVSGAPDRR
jgi:hypothetical protein